MKKLVLAIAVSLVSFVATSQISDSLKEIVSSQLNSFISSDNFNICLFNKDGFDDDNTNLFKITPNFLTDESIRNQFLEDDNVKRLKVGYSKKNQSIIMLGEWILNFKEYDSTYKKECYTSFYAEGGIAGQSMAVINANGEYVLVMQMFYEFKPIHNYSSKSSLPKMNLTGIIMHDDRIN